MVRRVTTHVLNEMKLKGEKIAMLTAYDYSFARILDEAEIDIFDLYPKICKKIDTDIEFINYMTMRFIAWDKDSLKYFSNNEEIANMHITNINGVLLKNKVISKENNKYICEAMYEDNDGYYKCKLAFNIDIIDKEYKIRSLIVVDREYIDHIYVLDEMLKSEYLIVYNINDQKHFLQTFYNDNPFTLKSNLENGVLFTRFNFNNNHVKPEDVVILTPKGKDKSILKEGLRLGNFYLTWSPTYTGIQVRTIQSFKGLEKLVVLIAELDRMSSDIEKLLYVGTSRARTELTCFYSDDLESLISRKGL